MPAPPKVLISPGRIEKRVKKIASLINNDYRNKKPVLVGILKGSFVFLADLIRLLKINLECDFIFVSSYGKNKKSSGRIKLIKSALLPMKNKDVIIVEDIIDSGLTPHFVINKIKRLSPKSIRFCVLLDKGKNRRIPVKIDYCGFKVPNKFIVGYGLDCAQKYRNLPYIGYV
jgi:hypoxanthine phosphoribosyltransferase